MFVKRSVVVLLTALGLVSCGHESSRTRDERSGDADSVAGKAGQAAHAVARETAKAAKVVGRETEKAAKVVGRETGKAARDVHEGWKEAADKDKRKE